MPGIEVELDRIATGGAALGPGPDGRVVFAAGGIPGERVTVSVDTEHARHLTGRVSGVDLASPDRRPAPCPHVADGCGGCDWQHVSPERQRVLRRDIVVDCLRRLGRIDDPDVRLGPELSPEGYRTTVRAAVTGGRAGLRAARSHDVVTVGSCLVAHPLVEELLVEGFFGEAREVTIRAGARTGERLVMAEPTARGIRVPEGVTVIGADEIGAGRTAWYHEEIGGQRLRISAPAFFQCRPDGAEALVDLARPALADHPGLLLDAYGGVGLFGALLARQGVIGVESNRASAADAAHNYAAAGTGPARVIARRFERWRPEPVAAVIADPARSGLGPAAAAVVAATGAAVVVLVSCDPASLARDARLLDGHGYRLGPVHVVDLFGHTSHVETVSLFERVAP